MEKENERLRNDNRALLDRILLRSGMPSITPVNEIVGGPRIVPRPTNRTPWRRNAATEAKAWEEFNELFPNAPSSDDIVKERAK